MARLARVAFLSLGLLVACASPDGTALTGYVFPRHRGFGNGGPTALVDGILEIRSGCLYVRGDDGHLSYVVWPPSYSLRPQGGSVAVFDGGTFVYAPGDRVREGGGSYKADFAEERSISGTLPAECATDEYFLATGRVDSPPP